MAHAPKIWALWSRLWSVYIVDGIGEAHCSHTGIWSPPSPSCRWKPRRTMLTQGGRFFYLDIIQVSTKRICTVTHYRHTARIIEVEELLRLWWVRGTSDDSEGLLSMLATSNKAGNRQTRADWSWSSMLHTDDRKYGICRTWHFHEGGLRDKNVWAHICSELVSVKVISENNAHSPCGCSIKRHCIKYQQCVLSVDTWVYNKLRCTTHRMLLV